MQSLLTSTRSSLLSGIQLSCDSSLNRWLEIFSVKKSLIEKNIFLFITFACLCVCVCVCMGGGGGGAAGIFLSIAYVYVQLSYHLQRI